MATDVAAWPPSLCSPSRSASPRDANKAYGYYRAEILAAFAICVVLYSVAFDILYEAYQRFREPVRGASGMMLAVAAVGLTLISSGCTCSKPASTEASTSRAPTGRGTCRERR